MIKLNRRRTILIATGVVVLLALVWAFMPSAAMVQTAVVATGELEVIVEEEGETRVVDRYVVSAPATAYMRRMEVEVGDQVAAGAPIAQLEAARSPALDPRSRAEGAGRVQAARAAVQRAEATAAQAAADEARMERLLADGAATRQAYEQAAADAVRAGADLSSARAELAAAEAALGSGPTTAGAAVQSVVRAPAAGRVLAVHHTSEGPVNAGDPLVEIGRPDHLEVVSNVLSQDAVRIRPGMPVILDEWGGEAPLAGVVNRVDPQGFTSVSALGVEERRVPVIVDISSPPSEWAATLGAGYRVLARFLVWRGGNVLQLPTSALFRSGEGWATFVVEGGRAVRRPVTIGQQAGLVTEVIDGLTAGEVVVTHPPNDLEDGARVRPMAP